MTMIDTTKTNKSNLGLDGSGTLEVTNFIAPSFNMYQGAGVDKVNPNGNGFLPCTPMSGLASTPTQSQVPSFMSNASKGSSAVNVVNKIAQ